MKTVVKYINEVFLQRYYLFVWLLLVIAGFLVYSNSFDAEFQLDDGFHILHQEEIQNFDNFGKLSTWLNINQRPLARFTLAFNYSINKLDVFGYHMFNLIIHILSACFLFMFLNQVFKAPTINNGNIRKNRHIIAFFCALVFLVHPIQTQSVTYIIQRMTSLAGLFYIMSVFFYIKGRYTQVLIGRRGVVWYIMAALAGLLAVLSKQNAVTFPVAWLLIEFFFVRNKNNKIFKTYLFVAISLIVIAFAWIVLQGLLPRETGEISRIDYLLTQFRVLVKYLQLTVLPLSQNLDYDFPLSTSISGIKEMISLGILLLFVILAIFSFKKHKLLSFGVFWFLLTLSVESSIIPITDVIFEHRLYLPIIGIILIVNILLFEILVRKSTGVFISVMLIITLFYGILTYARNEVWKTHESLWGDTVEKSPLKPRPNMCYGIAKLRKGNHTSSLKYFSKTITIDPEYYQAYFNRGNVRLHMQDYQGAISDLSIFIEHFPKLIEPRISLGKAMLLSGNIEGSLNAFNIALPLNPNNDKVYFNRANTLMFMHDFPAAIQDYLKSIQLNPDNPAAYNNAGHCYQQLQDTVKAMMFYNQAIIANPSYAKAYFNRANLFLLQKDMMRGLEDLNKTLENDPGYTLAYKGRGLVYFQLGEYKRAYDDLIKAKKLGAQVTDDLMNKIELGLLKQSTDY